MIRWRAPAAQRNGVIHDERHDRLIVFQVADRADAIDATAKVLIDQLHWAAMSKGDDIVR
jgi:hypothetical protein